jgi:hypothetical protein
VWVTTVCVKSKTSKYMPSTYVYTSKTRIGHDIQGGVETTKIDL